MGNCSGKEKGNAIDIPVAEEDPVEALPDAYKIVLIGDRAVGKSSIVKRFTENSFSAAHALTIGTAFASKDMSLQREDGETINVKLHIWDTAGEEQYRSMTRYFLREAMIGLVVYDVTDPKSASDMDEWINCLLEESPDCQIIVIGNKIDSTNRKVDAENIRKYATANQFEMLECSAKSGENIFEVFCKAAVIAYKQRNSYNGSVKVTHIMSFVYLTKQLINEIGLVHATPSNPPELNHLQSLQGILPNRSQ